MASLERTINPELPAGPYMPKSDLGKLQWMRNFVAGIQRKPEQFGSLSLQGLRGLRGVRGIRGSDLEYLVRTVREFSDALQRAKNPTSRTQSCVARKNSARDKAVELCRSYAMQIKADPMFTDADKKFLGIHVDDETLTPVMQPSSVPKIQVLSSPIGGHTIRFKPRAAVGSKAKPKGVTHMLLYAAIGDEPNLGVQHARLIGAYTKQPFDVNYPAGSGVAGKHITYYGRWLTGRGDIGPWSPGASMIVASECADKDVSFQHLFGKSEVSGQQSEVTFREAA